MSQKMTSSDEGARFENPEFSRDDTDNTKNANNGHVQDAHHAVKSAPQITQSKHQVASQVSEDTEVLDLSCGIGSLRTKVFGTRFANLYVFAICFALSNFFTSMVEQVVTVQLTSLERQFNIDNTRAGLFQTASRVGFISTVLFAGHFARKSHIPFIIGICGVLQGIFLTIPAIMQVVDPFTLPLLTSTTHDNKSNVTDYGDNAKFLCDTHFNTTNDTNHIKEPKGEVKQLQFIVVLVVQAAKGITDTFHSGFLPTLFIDDNLIDKSKMGIFLGIWQVISELSGPIGKQVNGILTKVPIDLKETEMEPSDGRFVAAWWLALLIFGLGTAVFSLPIMLFPRKLITSHQRQDALNKAVLTFAGGEIEDEVVVDAPVEPVEDGAAELEVHSKPVATVEQDGAELSESKRRRYSVHNAHARANSWKDSKRRKDSGLSHFSGSRRPSYFPPLVGPTERKISVAGDLIFEQPIKQKAKEDSVVDMLKDFPKALIRVLRKPVFVLLLADIAIISVPISGTSIFRNAYMANEYNVPMSDVALVSGITSALGHVIGTIISSWLSRKVTTKMGYMYMISGTYFFTLIIIPFYFVIGCGNEPVYGATGEFGRPVNISYCGCEQEQQLISCGGDGRNYYSPCYAGCTEVDGKNFASCVGINSTSAITLTPGLCETDCRTNFIVYTVIHGVQYVFSAMAMIPRRLLILRIVDPQDRGFATSLFMFCFVFMAIPSPNLFGKAIDATCLVWDKNVCSLYDRDKIRYLMSGIDIGVHGCVQTTFLIMMCIFKWEERRDKQKAKRESSRRDTTANVEL